MQYLKTKLVERKNTIVTLKPTVKVLSHQWHSGGVSQEERWAAFLLHSAEQNAVRLPLEHCTAAWAEFSSGPRFRLVWLQRQYQQPQETNLISKPQRNWMLLLDMSRKLVFRWHEGWAMVHPIGCAKWGWRNRTQASCPCSRRFRAGSMSQHTGLRSRPVFWTLFNSLGK